MSTRFRRALLSVGALALAAAGAHAQQPEAAPSQERERVREAGPSETGTPARMEQRTQAETRSIYTVRRGDTLSGIARRHGVSVRELARENRIQNVDRIPRGQELTIPGRRQAREGEPGQPGEPARERARDRTGEHRPEVGAGPPGEPGERGAPGSSGERGAGEGGRSGGQGAGSGAGADAPMRGGGGARGGRGR